MMAKFDRLDLWTLRQFLTRVVTRGHTEEDQLINLVTKIDQQLEGTTHDTIRQTGTRTDA
jgi:hypothetical protein